MPFEKWGKSGVLAYFWLKIGYFGHIFWHMDFKFVLPTIVINIKEETQLESQLDQNWPFNPLKMDRSGHISILVFA